MASDEVERVIVVGLDGLEPAIVEAMLASGELPHLEALRSRGGYGRLATTAPAQTPVAWSSFATGANPGVHGIFDFVGRDPASYRVELALNRYEQPGPLRPPRVVNRRRGTPLWGVLSERGIRSSVIRCPCTYPPDPVEGRLLSGMGVPDLRGGFGTGTYYTTDREATAGEAEQVVLIPDGSAEAIESFVIGPRHPRTGANVRLPIVFERGPDRDRLAVRSHGEPKELPLVRGRWSDWLRVTFKLGLLQSVAGLVRFLLVRSEADQLSIYASPVQFDPEAPPFPISHPERFAADLLGEIGPYHTTGLPEDHAALSNGRIDEAAFLAQCDDVWREREAMFEAELGRFESGLLYCLFDMTDRIQHLFWRYRDPGHPANRGRPRFAGSEDAIAECYRRADRAVGRALAAADDRTLVIALSDHGFGSFRRGVNLNTWLFENGLLALDGDAAPGDSGASPLGAIDWGRTRAYAIGLAGIYLNLRGREGEGTVEPEDADDLKRELIRALAGLRDSLDGSRAIRGVVPREACYRGPCVEDAADLLVLFDRGYRASWGSALGQVGASIFEDNTRLWAGDHLVDPALVPGVLFMNRPFRAEGASILDLAPTILGSFGLPPGPEMEGRLLNS